MAAVGPRPKRTQRAPKRQLDDVDDADVRRALANSLKQQKRVEHVIPEAPVFYPTAEEFKDPLAYISKITPEAEKYGICKVIPPQGHTPNTSFPRDRGLRFPTKRQLVNSLQEGKPFKSGTRYNLKEYQEYAEQYRNSYLNDHGLDPQEGTEADFHRKIEKEFWRIVETNPKEVTVDYANDLNSSKYGTGFEHDPENPWNLNSFHTRARSLMKEIQCEIPGVTIPWVYLGSLFTTFCWHTEDHFLYSINYMHKGHGKTWYGIPSTSARSFEDAMRKFMPDRFKQSPDLIFQLLTLLSPSYCMEHGVKVNHTVQKEGEYVITFPNTYHGGFSHGLNCAEAVNFAIPEWLSYGSQAMEKYHKEVRRGGHRSDIFAHDQLIYHLGSKISRLILSKKDVIQQNQGNPNALTQCIQNIMAEELPFDAKSFTKTLIQDYAERARMELHLREWLAGTKIAKLHKVTYSNATPPMCVVCKRMPYFSYVKCREHPERITCPEHAFVQCNCRADSKIHCIILSDSAITGMQKFIQNISNTLQRAVKGNPQPTAPVVKKEEEKTKIEEEAVQRTTTATTTTTTEIKREEFDTNTTTTTPQGLSNGIQGAAQKDEEQKEEPEMKRESPEIRFYRRERAWQPREKLT